MDPEEGPSQDPFRRSARVTRSPTGRSSAEGMDKESADGSRKRKETTPPIDTASRKIPNMDTDEEEEAGIGSPPAIGSGDYVDKMDMIKSIGNDLARWAIASIRARS